MSKPVDAVIAEIVALIGDLLAVADQLDTQAVRITPRRSDDTPLFTVLIVDEPEPEQMRELDALQDKWDTEGLARRAAPSNRRASESDSPRPLPSRRELS